MKRGAYGFYPSAAWHCAKSAEGARTIQKLIRMHDFFKEDFA